MHLAINRSNQISCRLFSLFIFAFCAVTPTLAEENWTQEPILPLNSEDIRTLEDITDQTLKYYPKEDYYFIFIGRSLAPIRALMDLKGIPNSGLPFSGRTIDLSFSSDFGQKLKPALLKHLEEFLPSENEIAGRKIVLLDFASSGRSLATAHKVLEWYFGGQRKFFLLRVVPFEGATKGFFTNFMRDRYTKTIVLPEDGRLKANFIYSNFDSFAGYGSFSLVTGAYRDFHSNSAARYDLLKSWLAERLSGKAKRPAHRSCFEYIN